MSLQPLASADNATLQPTITEGGGVCRGTALLEGTVEPFCGLVGSLYLENSFFPTHFETVLPGLFPQQIVTRSKSQSQSIYMSSFLF